MEIKGPKPLFGEGLYYVTTTKGDGYLWFSEDDNEWFNVEINDETVCLEGDVMFIHRKITEDQIIATEEVQVH